MQRWQYAGAAGLVVAALAAGAWFGGRPPQAPPVEIATAAAASRPDQFTVHVSGAVAKPGLVVVATGARVADALAAAGGVLPAADLSLLNLAAPLRDGEQVTVPTARTEAGGGRASDGRVRINVATADELVALPGVGAVTAARIVAHREQHGPFAAVEDLLDVPGIGEGKLAALRDSVIVP